jgi:hypothetical protein
MFNDDAQITDENVINNFKNISQSCDNLLSKDNIATVNLTNNNDNKNVEKEKSEISDISDDISIVSEIIIDEPGSTNVVEQTKPKRGRKKKTPI